jgi:hypothetical protein
METDGPAGEEVGVGTVKGDLRREGGKEEWVSATSKSIHSGRKTANTS